MSRSHFMSIASKLLLPTFIALSAASLTLACGGDDDDGGGGGGGGGGCADVCAKSKCAGDPDNASCVMQCEQLQQACPSEAAALNSCSAARPDSDWVCDDFDTTVLADGVCEMETNALFSCVFGTP